mgnify:CR=1 FL=1
MHPKNRAERRRISKKKYIDQSEREEAIQLRLAEEAREAREALDALRHEVLAKEPND